MTVIMTGLVTTPSSTRGYKSIITMLEATKIFAFLLIRISSLLKLPSELRLQKQGAFILYNTFAKVQYIRKKQKWI